MKKFLSHISIFFIFFIAINFITAFFWKPIDENIISAIDKKDYYSKEVLDSVGISQNEQIQFYNEMWSNRKFKYIQFAEHLEAETKKQKYVNVTKDFGRKIQNNKNCEIRYFFYGASQTFGYNVKDNQTIPSYFKKIIDKEMSKKNNCVYNFGSAGYFSSQENILFLNHILEKKIFSKDYAIFMDGYTEQGNNKSRIHYEIKSIFDGIDLKVWDELKFSSLIFTNSLPIVKLYNNLQKKFSNKPNKPIVKKVISDQEKLDEINRVFKSNLQIRSSICKSMSINCYTFLPPIPKKSILMTKTKYKLFQKLPELIDISEILNENEYLAFVEGGHYSPKSSGIIAETIFNNITFD